ncbi:MAG: SAM-dependent methyltransferase [Pseudolabrys sp.]|jgi:SAM-dependent MidA family methyltransferase
MNAPSPLEIDIRRRIAAAGPMPVSQYMGMCLSDPQHGYYITRDPLGARGDFITAPEVSQMFGELIGIWMSAVWKQIGAPEQVRVVELGPGRGTLMKDAMRAAQVVPAFRQAVVIDLVEISPVLREQQRLALQPHGIPTNWYASINDVPDGPAIVIANEFFDALPVSQAVKLETGWHERCVGIGDDGRLAFVLGPEPMRHLDVLLPQAAREAPVDSIFEWRADTAAVDLGRRVAKGGAALVIDYGHSRTDFGDTLQAVGSHAYADPLIEPGQIDLTAHVDFEPLARVIEAMGAKAYGPITQSLLLRRLGIETRATTLKAKATRAQAAEVDLALARLIGIGRTGMGELFKAAAYVAPSLGPPPAFDA